eukprot:16446331-Heterocapsa_arctica.AAC.2
MLKAPRQAYGGQSEGLANVLGHIPVEPQTLGLQRLQNVLREPRRTTLLVDEHAPDVLEESTNMRMQQSCVRCLKEPSLFISVSLMPNNIDTNITYMRQAILNNTAYLSQGLGVKLPGQLQALACRIGEHAGQTKAPHAQRPADKLQELQRNFVVSAVLSLGHRLGGRVEPRLAPSQRRLHRERGRVRGTVAMVGLKLHIPLLEDVAVLDHRHYGHKLGVDRLQLCVSEPWALDDSASPVSLVAVDIEQIRQKRPHILR